MVNRNIAAMSDRFIIGSSERQMTALVEHCGIADMPYSERSVIDIVSSSADDSLIQIQRKHAPKYFYLD